MRRINKEIFLNTLVCPTLGWTQRNEAVTSLTDQATPTAGVRFRLEQGIAIGTRARSLYPDGILISEPRFGIACTQTQDCLKEPSTTNIFEGAFQIEGFGARADVLNRTGDSWGVTEVKSNVNVSNELIDDLAYTTAVLRRSGLEISTTSLLTISRDYRLGLDDALLFVESDHTDAVSSRTVEFVSSMDWVDDATRAAQKPDPQLIFACGKCPLFGECTGKGIEHSIFDIPRLSVKKFQAMKESGVLSITQIPDSFGLTDIQKVVASSVKSGKTMVDPRLKDELDNVQWPVHYLDFEAVQTAVPLYPDIPPHASIPFQYSAHKCDVLGNVVDHAEYLADGTADPRPELARKLINDLAGTGSIVVYTGYEKRVITGLASLLPTLAAELNAIIIRLVDLNDILKRNFYHPDFHGSTSLKITLPVLVPEMSYDGLAISEGESAMAEFAYLMQGEYQPAKADIVRQNLLEYCKQDTMALVNLHARLADIASC